MPYYQYHRGPELRFVTSAKDGISIKAYADTVRHFIKKHPSLASKPAFQGLNALQRKTGLFVVSKLMVLEFFDWRDPPFGSRYVRAFPYPIKPSILRTHAKKFDWVNVYPTDFPYTLNAAQLSDPLPRNALAEKNFDILMCDQKQWDRQCEEIMNELNESKLSKHAFLYDILPHILFTSHGPVSVERVN